MVHFYSAAELSARVESYFLSVAGKQVPEAKPQRKTKKKESAAVVREAHGGQSETPTLTGLALYLGFPSIADFEEYEQNGVYKKTLKEARLRIEYEYEKKLLKPSPAGAIFALRCMGWNEKKADKKTKPVATKVQIKVMKTGPDIASAEKDVEV